MKTMADIQTVLDRVECPPFEFLVRPWPGAMDDGQVYQMGTDGNQYLVKAPIYLQFQCSEGTCNVTGEALTWRGRKWLLSRHMTDGEIVQTAFKALLTALEHEAREQFKYRGVTIFDPHYDIEKLVELRSDEYSTVERSTPGA